MARLASLVAAFLLVLAVARQPRVAAQELGEPSFACDELAARSPELRRLCLLLSAPRRLLAGPTGGQRDTRSPRNGAPRTSGELVGLAALARGAPSADALSRLWMDSLANEELPAAGQADRSWSSRLTDDAGMGTRWQPMRGKRGGD